MLYHVLLTDQCNLCCTYCGGFTIEDPEKAEVSYSIEDLKRFIERDTEPDIAFYGGEPLLRIPLLMEMMDALPARHFMIQTNATMLDKLPTAYLKRLHTLLVSVDGREQTTDSYRGDGVYHKAIGNARNAKKRGFAGDLVARMAVSEESDIYEEVKHLQSLELFDHIHWQLDVIWGDEWDDLDGWIANSYKPGITRLVGDWLEEMQRGRILGIAPFQPVLADMIAKRSSQIRCGSGISSFAITPRGEILTCPVCPEFQFAYLGDIRNAEKPPLVTIGEPCTSCDIFGLCGGRCLFANKTKLWGEEGQEKVCGTVRHMIGELERIRPRVEKLLDEGVIKWEDMDYPRVNNCCEIIP
ncbi:MAG: TIGR04084 family radical SAM/SPASM domain-containing protein [Candidatus Thermoplasmatota archaeon]|nr:TIGR04084 family radical SAM/SPASM domain-containing protein [Candidatus Thermoplasmatota archaeon]